MKDRRQIWLIAAFIAVFAVTRWPGLLPSNFSAAYALMFCAGMFFPLRFATWLPLLVMLVTDILLNVLWYHVAPLGAFMVVNYAGYLALIAFGRLLRNRRSFATAVGGALLGAILFYLITNTLSWLQLAYAKTVAGWIVALTRGLDGLPPTWEFFRNSLLSSGLFTALFAAAQHYSAHAESAAEKRAAEAPAEHDEEEEKATDPEPEKSPA